MDQSPPFPGGLLAIVIASIPVVIVHEAGHAYAARRLLDVDVAITVGSAGKVAEIQLGRVRMQLNALSGPTRMGGSAQFAAGRATACDVLLIALAGPAASLAGLLVSAYLLSMAPAHGVVHALLWAATLGGVFGVLNLIPLRFQERKDGPAFRSDGRLALDALAVLRAG